MNAVIHPWARGPFELILHAEEHYLRGEDFDRCIALICFDNAIEISISTYLSLDPVIRGGKRYQQQDINGWQRGFRSKLDFLENELEKRNLSWAVNKREILWAHDCRNRQYHEGTSSIPNDIALDISRRASKWVFSLLFDVEDIDYYLEIELRERMQGPIIQHDEEIDRIIDQAYGVIEVAGQIYGTSEVLFAVDPSAYWEIGEALRNELNEEAVTETGDGE